MGQFIPRTDRIINQFNQILLRFCYTNFIELITFEVHVLDSGGICI